MRTERRHRVKKLDAIVRLLCDRLNDFYRDLPAEDFTDLFVRASEIVYDAARPLGMDFRRWRDPRVFVGVALAKLKAERPALLVDVLEKLADLFDEYDQGPTVDASRAN